MKKLKEIFQKKEKKTKKVRPTVKEIFASQTSRHGAMSMGMIALVIAIVVIINLIMGQLPERFRNVDLTDQNLYEISDVSKEILKNLDSDIEIKVLAVKKSADDRIKTFLSKYTALSKKVDVEWIDPVEHPSALEKYGADSNSIVVSCPDTDKSKVIRFNDILVADQMAYYTTGSTSPTSFDADGQLTSAINYVTNDVSKKIYLTTGHGEGSFGTSVTDLMDKMNFQLDNLNLLMENKIPEDCDMLLMYAPTKDLTEDECKTLKTYLEQGGNVYLILGAVEDKLSNLESVMEEYGLSMADGYIADPQRCYQGNYYYIFPELSVSGDLANDISSQMVLLVNSRGMTQTEPARDSITVTPFMKSSSSAHAVTEEGDEEGTYILGATATETIGDETEDSETEEEEDSEEKDEEETKEACLTVITAPSMIDEQITGTFSTLENLTLFTNSISANFEDVQNVAIEPKSLEVTYNTMQHVGLIGLAVIFGFPLVVLVWGFVVWWKRRKA